jgi:hypothetical protein
MSGLIIITAVSTLIALGCAVHLWRRRASVLRKLFWTLVLLVPIVGPVFYGGMFEVPSIQPEGLRSNNEWHGSCS